jgi:aldose 1-epimerase
MVRFHFCFSLSVCGFLLGTLFGCGGNVTDPRSIETTPTDSAAGPAADSSGASLMSVQSEPYGKGPNGQNIEQYLLTNDNDMTVSIINWGATVTSVMVPDRDGNVENVALGFDGLPGYLANAPYFGGICGRYSNRIAKGLFTLGDSEYSLHINNEPNHLHGGRLGFNRVVWQAKPVEDEERNSVGVKFTYISADGEEGYPGNLAVTVVYSLNNDNELTLDYTATTDKDTVLNLTNHCYWNLAGLESGPVLGHQLELNCDKFLPVDETLIPTGELKSVEGTPMDFTKPATIGSRIADVVGGYDHCYVVNKSEKLPALVATVTEPKSGRVMTVHSTEPGVQLYTGNFLDGSDDVNGFEQHTGFCLECQHFPDSPNRPEFPSTVLRLGEVYRQTTVHRFSVVD